MTTTARSEQIHFARPSITEDDISAVTEVLRSGWLTTGRVAREFEEQLAATIGVRHVVATSSCTSALECAVAALRLPPRARVAVPAWTFVSTVTVLLRLGLEPVLLDVEPETLNVSSRSLERAVERGVAAVLPVHFAGTPVSPQVFDISRTAGIHLVEDCAHALGTRLPSGRGSLAGCYSFYATKNLTSAEGGAVATDDDEVAAFAQTYRLHGMSRDAWRRYEPGASPVYDVEHTGIKANLPDLLAALGLSQLKRFPESQAHRRALVHRYREQLSGLPGLRVVPGQLDPASADHLMVVVLPEAVDRSTVVARMAADGISVSIHFRPVHQFTALRSVVDVAGGLSTCDQVWPRVLSLPLHPELFLDDVDRVVESLSRALRSDG